MKQKKGEVIIVKHDKSWFQLVNKAENSVGILERPKIGKREKLKSLLRTQTKIPKKKLMKIARIE